MSASWNLAWLTRPFVPVCGASKRWTCSLLFIHASFFALHRGCLEVQRRGGRLCFIRRFGSLTQAVFHGARERTDPRIAVNVCSMSTGCPFILLSTSSRGTRALRVLTLRTQNERP